MGKNIAERCRCRYIAHLWSSVSRVSSLVSLSRAWDRQVNPTEPGENQFRGFFLPESLEKHDKGRIGLFIPPLTEVPELDPTLYVLEYIRRTDGLLPTDQDPADTPLWVSTRKPHGKVISTTLANWFQKAMQKGGIDTSIFKTHSSRSASSQYLKGKNLSMVQILHRGGWTVYSDNSSAVFIRFYQKHVV